VEEEAIRKRKRSIGDMSKVTERSDYVFERMCHIFLIFVKLGSKAEAGFMLLLVINRYPIVKQRVHSYVL